MQKLLSESHRRVLQTIRSCNSEDQLDVAYNWAKKVYTLKYEATSEQMTAMEMSLYIQRNYLCTRELVTPSDVK